jgi:hypothetical protein
MRLMRDAQREEMDIMRDGSRWWNGEESSDGDEEVIGIDADLTGLNVSEAEMDY